MAARSNEGARRARCAAFVGGFGVPGLRDLDFGRQFITCVEHLDWDPDVVVEELPCGPTLVLQRLEELRPAKLVLVGAVARGLDPPGTIRHYTPRPPAPHDDVHEHLVSALAGDTDLDHTLAVVRHWGQLPADTVVIEVEPADTSPGLGFTEDVGARIDSILAMVLAEVSRPDHGGTVPALGEMPGATVDPPPAEPTGLSDVGSAGMEAPSPALLDLVDYARAYERTSGMRPPGPTRGRGWARS